MEEPQRRQRTMLCDQLSSEAAAELRAPAPPSITAASSNNLRNLLTVRQEEDHQPLCERPGSASVSLGTVIACEKRDQCAPGIPVPTSPPVGSSRTLLDIIRNEESIGGRRFFDDGFMIRSGNNGHKVSWRAFKDRLRIRRASSAWQTPVAAAGGGGSVHVLPPPSPSSRNDTHGEPLPEPNPSSSVPNTAESLRPPNPAPIMALNCAAPAAAGPEQGGPSVTAPLLATYGEGPPPHPPTPQSQQIRVSLMALLEQTDRQTEGPGFAVSALLEAANEAQAGVKEEDEEEEGAGGDGGGKMFKCCVCMVRHKGAAFIPCGHTFCRLCSRELWVSRGNCPLCNGFILEILDIF